MCQVPFYVAFYVNNDQIFKFHKSGTWNPNSLALTLEGNRIPCVLYNGKNQSSKLAGSPMSEESEIMLRTSETILALVRSD